MDQALELAASLDEIEEEEEVLLTDVTDVVQRLKNKQNEVIGLVLSGFFFTRDKPNISTVMYKCVKYQKLRCSMRIRFDKKLEKFFVKGIQHCHPCDHNITFDLLTEERREQLLTYLKGHPQEERNKVIIQNLNKDISPGDPTSFITEGIVRS